MTPDQLVLMGLLIQFLRREQYRHEQERTAWQDETHPSGTLPAERAHMRAYVHRQLAESFNRMATYAEQVIT